ncbi:MAG: transporter substrate-binding domain-containing protein [Clostridia bacterium]|nr:transporter substrate-binding domain-containing protein [Clostridia bacterium]
MKKLSLFLAAVMSLGTIAMTTACGEAEETIYVDTNAYFAPFEYYDADGAIQGVDIEIMNKVGEKLGKKVKFENTDFGVIIDNVSSGKKYDCGAAGITVTDARKEKVDFSDTYFKSVQYVIYKGNDMEFDGTATDGTDYILWSSLAGKKIGVQLDTTGHIYVDGEINATEDNDEYGYDGAIYGTGAECVTFDNAQLATDAIGVSVDVVVVDELPANYIVAKNENLHCYALYYDNETATEEEYAICVTKGNTELLNAINEVLKELGKEGINALVKKHLGL